MPFERIKQLNYNETKLKYSELIIFTFLLLVVIVPYFWLMNISDDISVKLLFYYFDSSKITIHILNFLGFFITSGLIHIIISALVFNFSNIFKLIIINAQFYIIIGLCCILKLIYLKKPIYVTSNQYLEPTNCGTTLSWAFPSVPASILTNHILTLWWIYWFSKSKNYNKIYKFVLYIILIVSIVLVNLIIHIFSLISITDTFFSALIGLMVFYFVFFILKVDINKSSDLIALLNKKQIYFISTGLIICFYIFLFIFRVPTEEDKILIAKKVSYTDCYFVYPLYTNLSNDSLILITIFASNIGMILGLYMELKVLKKDDSLWGFFNFNDDDQNDLEEIMTYDEDIKEAQWNNTPILKTLLRLFICFIFCSLIITCIMVFPFFDNNLFLTMIIKYFLPYTFFSFSFFFIQKWLFIKLSLVNTNALKDNETDSINQEPMIDENK